MPPIRGTHAFKETADSDRVPPMPMTAAAHKRDQVEDARWGNEDDGEREGGAAPALDQEKYSPRFDSDTESVKERVALWEDPGRRLPDTILRTPSSEFRHAPLERHRFKHVQPPGETEGHDENARPIMQL